MTRWPVSSARRCASVSRCPPTSTYCPGLNDRHVGGTPTHLGLWLDIPTFGCAKTRLIGAYDEPGPNAGDVGPLRDKDEIIGLERLLENKSQ